MNSTKDTYEVQGISRVGQKRQARKRTVVVHHATTMPLDQQRESSLSSKLRDLNMQVQELSESNLTSM